MNNNVGDVGWLSPTKRRIRKFTKSLAALKLAPVIGFRRWERRYAVSMQPLLPKDHP